METKVLAPLDAGTPCSKPEHEQFAQRVAVHGNAVAAYRDAYPNCGEPSAQGNANRLMKHPDVARRVLELQEAQRAKILAAASDLELLVANMAIGVAAEVFDDDNRILPFSEWPTRAKAACEGLDVKIDAETGRITDFKPRFPSPLQAARLLAQLRGALIERKDLTSGGRPLQSTPLSADLEAAAARWAAGEKPAIEGEFTEVTEDPEDVSDLV